MSRVLALAPDREPEIASIAESLLERSRVDSAFACIDAITDAALLQGDAPRAASALQAFIERAPHAPALAKLVEIAVEAGLADRLRGTQAQLVDAYLEASRGGEARIIAEQLVRGEPANEAHAERLRRALTIAGVPDPEKVLAQVRSATENTPSLDALSFETLDLDAVFAEVTTAQALPLPNPGAQASDVRFGSVTGDAVSDSALLGDETETLTGDMGEIDLVHGALGTHDGASDLFRGRSAVVYRGGAVRRGASVD